MPADAAAPAPEPDAPAGRLACRLLRDPAMSREAFCLVYGIIALCFVFFHGRPRNASPEAALFIWFGVNLLLLFVVPALYIRFVRRESLARYGLRVGDFGTWSRYFLVFLLGMVPVVMIASRDSSFHMYYPRLALARYHVEWLLLSAAGWLVYFFAWEWFFRGFMLFSLAPRLGGAIAICMQTIPFVMMHVTKIESEAWASIICGLALGVMAYRGRSFIGPWLLHWLIATSMDVIVVVWPLRLH